MPRLKAATPAKSAPVKQRVEEAKPPQRTASRAAPSAAPKAAAAPKSAPATGDLRGKIIADAVRLLKWGKPWHELADLIARIADRPSAAEIRKVLRASRSEIEQKAGK